MKRLITLIILISVLFSCKKEFVPCTGGTGTLYINGVEQEITSITTYFSAATL